MGTDRSVGRGIALWSVLLWLVSFLAVHAQQLEWPAHFEIEIEREDHALLYLAPVDFDGPLQFDITVRCVAGGSPLAFQGIGVSFTRFKEAGKPWVKGQSFPKDFPVSALKTNEYDILAEYHRWLEMGAARFESLPQGNYSIQLEGWDRIECGGDGKVSMFFVFDQSPDSAK